MPDVEPWSAPARSTPIDARVRVPGSKSLMNRALVLAALAESPSVIRQGLTSRDSELMAAAIVALGAQIHREGDDWYISPIPTTQRSTASARASIDCGLAGTVMRFVPAVAATTPLTTTFDGDDYARERPMNATISALRDLGVAVDDDGRGTLPFSVEGTASVVGGRLDIDASASSQFVSALLLAGARFAQGIDLRHVGDTLPSTPHVDMTIAELRRRGVSVDEPARGRWVVHPGPIKGVDLVLEPDLSNAGPFVAAALITRGRVAIEDWPADTHQAGARWVTIAESFGGWARREGEAMIFGAEQTLTGVDLDLHDVGELTPVIAAIAALAEGPSRLTGIAHLRGHETDRLSALATELRAVGAEVDEHHDGLTITPGPLRPTVFGTYADHRMAHAGTVVGLHVSGLQIEDIGCTAKTWPGFAAVWEHLVA